MALADEARPVAAEVTSIKAPAPAAPSDVSNYAEREAQNTKTAEFQGGQTVVVISGAALVLLVLLVLLI